MNNYFVIYEPINTWIIKETKIKPLEAPQKSDQEKVSSKLKKVKLKAVLLFVEGSLRMQTVAASDRAVHGSEEHGLKQGGSGPRRKIVSLGAFLTSCSWWCISILAKEWYLLSRESKIKSTGLDGTDWVTHVSTTGSSGRRWCCSLSFQRGFIQNLSFMVKELER